MNDKIKKILITEIEPYFLNWTKCYIWPYVTGLIGIRKNGNQEEVVLRGSGTLIEKGSIHGVLTAQHVVADLKKYDKVGLIISDSEQRYCYDKQFLNFVEVAKPLDISNYSQGPDLAVIILPNISIGTLKAIKSFYSLSHKNKEMIEQPIDYNEGLWFLSGFPDEHTRKVNSTIGHTYAKEFHCLCGESPIQKKYICGEYDFVEVGINYNIDKTLPNSWGGISGCGLWHVLLKQSEKGDIEVKESILSGVGFYQTDKENNKRYIRCHGHRSIYKNVYEAII